MLRFIRDPLRRIYPQHRPSSRVEWRTLSHFGTRAYCSKLGLSYETSMKCFQMSSGYGTTMRVNFRYLATQRLNLQGAEWLYLLRKKYSGGSWYLISMRSWKYRQVFSQTRQFSEINIKPEPFPQARNCQTATDHPILDLETTEPRHLINALCGNLVENLLHVSFLPWLKAYFEAFVPTGSLISRRSL